MNVMPTFSSSVNRESRSVALFLAGKEGSWNGQRGVAAAATMENIDQPGWGCAHDLNRFLQHRSRGGSAYAALRGPRMKADAGAVIGMTR